MAKLEEVESFCIGHEFIDEQHGRLFALIEEMRLARNSADPLAEYRLSCRVMAELVEYTSTHFAEEERLMQEAAYPGYEAHKQEHEVFTQRIREVEEDMHLGDSVLTLDFFCDLLEGWLKEHILQTDRQYVPYLLPAAANAA